MRHFAIAKSPDKPLISRFQPIFRPETSAGDGPFQFGGTAPPGSVVMKVHAGTGASSRADAFAAGREAAHDAASRLAGEKPAVVFVFTSPKYDMPALLAGVRSITGDARLIGATGSGEIVGASYMGFGGGVGVLALSAGSYRFGVASESYVRGRLDLVGQSIARASRDQAGPSPYAAVVLMADCLAGDLQQLFQGVYRVTGPKVPIVGGAAGDELKFVRTLVFQDDQVVEQGAVALWIASERPIEVITRHGWEPIGVPLLVTRAEGIDIIELDGRPAAAVYEEQLDLAPGELSAENFWGTSVHHPLGLLQSDGSSIIRVARSKGVDGRLRIQGCVPPAGSAVQVMASTSDKLLDIIDDFGGLVRNHPEAGALLSFSCAARAMLLGSRIAEEPQRLQIAAGAIPSFGIYCCGEFARTVGVLGTHNCTLTSLVL